MLYGYLVYGLYGIPGAIARSCGTVNGYRIEQVKSVYGLGTIYTGQCYELGDRCHCSLMVPNEHTVQASYVLAVIGFCLYHYPKLFPEPAEIGGVQSTDITL